MKDSADIPVQELLDALRAFVKDEPEAVAQILARCVRGFSIQLVIHEHRAAEEDGVDPGEVHEREISESFSEGISFGKGASPSGLKIAHSKSRGGPPQMN